MSDPEKKLTAYHETGHTLIGLLHNDVSVVHKVTIIPRGRAGGYTMSLPKEDRNYQTKSEMLDELQMLLGGRVAEAIVLKDISSGASSDLQRATALARKMVCQYGMSDRLGSMTFGHPEEEVFLGRDIARERYSNEVAAVIDEEVRRLMDEAYKGAEKLLQENMDKLVLIACPAGGRSVCRRDRMTVSHKKQRKNESMCIEYYQCLLNQHKMRRRCHACQDSGFVA